VRTSEALDDDGLGLSIAESIIRLHGGSVSADTYRGARVSFTLALLPPMRMSAQIAPAQR
jgi:signal transduction histidine kinase